MYAPCLRIDGINSRAREGRDRPAEFTATGRGVFQFTRPRGARRCVPVLRSPASRGFNSRAREGRDSDPLEFSPAFAVSIHAPARGATSTNKARLDGMQFQFTRPRGARLPEVRVLFENPWFQFTRPRGARHHGHGQHWHLIPCFNSRAREGRDAGSNVHSRHALGFQFTRPRGARRRHGRNLRYLLMVSIHAPARGATKTSPPRQ